MPNPVKTPKNILLVEDNADMLHLYVAYLSGFDVAVTSRQDVPSALSTLGTGPGPDVVVLDHNVAGGGAPAFLEGLRSQWSEGGAAKPRLPVIVLITGKEDIADIASRLRVDAYLRKPVSIEDFERTVGAFL